VKHILLFALPFRTILLLVWCLEVCLAIRSNLICDKLLPRRNLPSNSSKCPPGIKSYYFDVPFEVWSALLLSLIANDHCRPTSRCEIQISFIILSRKAIRLTADFLSGCHPLRADLFGLDAPIFRRPWNLPRAPVLRLLVEMQWFDPLMTHSILSTSEHFFVNSHCILSTFKAYVNSCGVLGETSYGELWWAW
jgi:hypothetical protein